jgi:hypothetical protein
MALSLQASPRLELPSRWISRDWIDGEYKSHIQAKQKLRASLDVQAMDAQLMELSASPGGLNFMAKEQRNPLLREALYEDITGKVYMNYKLTQGEQPMFWADIDVTASAIGPEGLPSPVETTSDMHLVYTAMYAGATYVRWNLSNSTLFDILGAAQQRLKASLMFQLAAGFYQQLFYASGLRGGQGTTFGLLGSSAASNNAPASVQNSTTGIITVDQLIKATANFGARLITGPKKLIINPSRRADIVLFNTNMAGTGGNGFFVPEIQTELMQMNRSAGMDFLGNEILEDVLMPATISLPIDSLGITSNANENVIGIMVGPPEFCGVKVIRTDLVLESQKDLSLFADKIAGWMDVGFYSRWGKAMQRLVTI